MDNEVEKKSRSHTRMYVEYKDNRLECLASINKLHAENLNWLCELKTRSLD